MLLTLYGSGSLAVSLLVCGRDRLNLQPLHGLETLEICRQIMLRTLGWTSLMTKIN